MTLVTGDATPISLGPVPGLPRVLAATPHKEHSFTISPLATARGCCLGALVSSLYAVHSRSRGRFSFHFAVCKLAPLYTAVNPTATCNSYALSRFSSPSLESVIGSDSCVLQNAL